MTELTSSIDPGAPAADDPRLTAHLRAYLGAWPPDETVQVVGWPGRLEPAWNGSYVVGVVLAAPVGTLVSVAPDMVGAVARLEPDPADGRFPERFGAAIGAPGRVSPWLIFRWTSAPAALAGGGRWVRSADPSVPGWLHAFPGDVLALFDDGGAYLAGVGIKAHTRWGKELAVGTDERARGRGLARRLVAEAAQSVLDEGAVPLYVHHPANDASARVADAAGLPDRGWRLVVAWGPSGSAPP